jgi:hypothetical protein
LGTPLGVLLPSGGVLKNLSVNAQPNEIGIPPTSTTQVEISVWVNAVKTNLVCTMTWATSTRTSSCADTAHTVNVNGGDAVVIQMISSVPGFWGAAMSVTLEKQ